MAKFSQNLFANFLRTSLRRLHAARAFAMTVAACSLTWPPKHSTKRYTKASVDLRKKTETTKKETRLLLTKGF